MSELSFSSEYSDFGSLEIDSDSPVDYVFSSEEDIHKTRKAGSVINSIQLINSNVFSKSQLVKDTTRLISNRERSKNANIIPMDEISESADSNITAMPYKDTRHLVGPFGSVVGRQTNKDTMKTKQSKSIVPTRLKTETLSKVNIEYDSGENGNQFKRNKNTGNTISETKWTKQSGMNIWSGRNKKIENENDLSVERKKYFDGSFWTPRGLLNGDNVNNSVQDHSFATKLGESNLALPKTLFIRRGLANKRNTTQNSLGTSQVGINDVISKTNTGSKRKGLSTVVDKIENLPLVNVRVLGQRHTFDDNNERPSNGIGGAIAKSNNIVNKNIVNTVSGTNRNSNGIINMIGSQTRDNNGSTNQIAIRSHLLSSTINGGNGARLTDRKIINLKPQSTKTRVNKLPNNKTTHIIKTNVLRVTPLSRLSSAVENDNDADQFRRKDHTNSGNILTVKRTRVNRDKIASSALLSLLKERASVGLRKLFKYIVHKLFSKYIKKQSLSTMQTVLPAESSIDTQPISRQQSNTETSKSITSTSSVTVPRGSTGRNPLGESSGNTVTGETLYRRIFLREQSPPYRIVHRFIPINI